MMKYLQTLLILFSLGLFSCATVSCSDLDGTNIVPNTLTEATTKILPRQSFLKIDRNVKLKYCPNLKKPDECINRKMRSSGSGFLIGTVPYGAFMITAAHVCDVSDMVKYIESPHIKHTGDEFFVYDEKGAQYAAVILEMDKESDLCAAFVHGLQGKPAIIADTNPLPGDKAYNLAAPVGFFAAGVIPTLDGYYNGKFSRYASYSVPAVGGSSGSPVFNSDGEVIGMIHSVHTRFQFLTFSPTLREIRDLARKYVKLKTN